MSRLQTSLLKYCLKPGLTISLLSVAAFILWSMPRLPIKLLSVTSASMAPTISVGSLVISAPAPAYSPGEVIVYQPPGTIQLIMHRVVDRYDSGSTYYITQGDANRQADRQTVPASAVIGRVVFSLPLLGYFITWARTPTGLILLTLIPSIYLIYDSIVHAL